MTEEEGKDLQQIFEGYNQRLETLEVLTGHKYPVTSRKEFMAACMKAGKDMEECSDLWKEVSKKKEAGEQTKEAYAAPYGMDFIKSVIAILEKIGVKLSPEDLKKLKALSGEQLIYVEPKPERITTFSVLPQEPGRTGEESLVSEGVDLLMKRGSYSNIAHQEEIHKTKVRLGLREPGDDED